VPQTALSVATASRKVTPRALAAAARLLLLLLPRRVSSSWLSLRALPRARVDANATASSMLQMEQRRRPVELKEAAAKDVAEGRGLWPLLAAPAPLEKLATALRRKSPTRIALQLLLPLEPQLLPLEARAWQDQRDVELEESPEALAQCGAMQTRPWPAAVPAVPALPPGPEVPRPAAAAAAAPHPGAPTPARLLAIAASARASTAASITNEEREARRCG
jgi:hypothetical protein